MITYSYVCKARFNMETYPVIAMACKLPTFNMILMSIDKKLRTEQEQQW